MARRPRSEARGLPGVAYTDAAVLAWEREHLFGATWVCLGRADVVGRPGDQRATTAGTTGVLVTCADPGTRHVLANVCRHRAHELLPDGTAAQRAVVQCPYHAWTYELDGRLRLAPGLGAAALDAAPGLVPLRHAEWGGWLFVDPSGDAAALADHVGALADLLEPWPLDTLVVAAAERYVVHANWKLVHENYHECYHCPLIHPELCRVSPPNSGANYAAPRGAWLGGTMDLSPDAVTMSLDGASGGRPFDALDAHRRRQVVYVGLGWDLLVSAHPDYVLTHRLQPLAPDRTAIECQWLFPREVVHGAHFDPGYAVSFWDLTNRQDWAAIESVQRGVANPAHRPGPFAMSEDAVHGFVRRVAEAYAGQ